MYSRYFWFYHIAGWLLVYAAILLSIYDTIGFTNFEFLFGGVLISSAALYAYFTRLLYKRYLVYRGLGKQTLYFLFQSLMGAGLSSLMLVAFVVAASEFAFINPISPKQYGFYLSNIFWGNAINMLVAFIVWSALYVSIIRARQLGEAKQALATSQLHSLIQQLNPHFLFNMLNNIRALILEDPNKAREALAQLSDMLRYSLNQFAMHKVNFKEELGIVEEYLALCKIQYEERLSYQFEIEDGVNSVLIPRMLLQLCVENAIKHGIAGLKQGGCIELSASIEQQMLCIKVTNPLSDSEEQCEKATVEGAGVGLRNISDRLALLYPKEGSFQSASILFDKQLEKGIAQIQIKLPIEYDEG